MSKATHKFYETPEWKTVRENYRKKVGGLCEYCLARGIYNACEAVHHKIHVTPQNMYNPQITLNEDNLVALCRECHGNEHRKDNPRYIIDKDTGEVQIKGAI